MATIPVSKVTTGEKLQDPVVTRMGNVLFLRDKLLTQRDIEILKAFLIPTISIVSQDNVEQLPEEPNGSELSAGGKVPSFYIEYEKMLQLMKKVFDINSINSVQSIPIFDLRTQMEALLQNIESYNVLTFSRRYFHLSDYIYHNSIMVSLTSYLLANWNGLQPKDHMPVALAGLLHDIGNVKVDTGILVKPAQLSAEEIHQVKKHTVIGYNILKNVPSINEGVKLCALQHHEREDGSGYPLGLTGDKIHKYAKIVAVADIYHAMTSQRPYKKALSPYLVLEQLFNSAFGKLDPAIVQTFINKATQIGIGTVVKLSDDRVGEIVFTDRANPTRPWVNVNGTIINLTQQRSLFIEEMIQF